MTTYVVRTRRIDEYVKSTNPGFFRVGTSIEGAMTVRHDLNSPSFFPAYEAGLTMTPVTYEMTGYEWDWEEGRFAIELPENTLTNEWEFALVNNFGEVFYEIGSGNGARLWRQTCRDLIRWDSLTEQWFNRFATSENATKVEYVFGGCESTCPEREFTNWSAEQRALATREVKANSPNQVGSEFTMYGYAGDGICQFDILVPGNEPTPKQIRVNPDQAQYFQNRIMHWAPADFRGDVRTNARNDHKWSGAKTWPGAWPFGAINDPTSRDEWRVRIIHHEDTIEFQACTSWSDDSTCETKANDAYEFGYRTGDISGVQTAIGYPQNLLRSDGQCDFYARIPGSQKNPSY